MVLIKRKLFKGATPIVKVDDPNMVLAQQRAKEVEKEERNKPKTGLTGNASRLPSNWKRGMSILHDQYYLNNPSRKEVREMAVKVKVGVLKKEEVKKKAEAKIKRGKTIDDLWVEVLSKAVGKRFTDKVLAVKMSEEATKLTGKKRHYDEASVASHRSGYNNGKFPCQKGIKPKVRLEKTDSPK